MSQNTLFHAISMRCMGVIGDFCLDAYWHADMRKSRLSSETPHYPLPVYRERYSPGGAGNVVANLCALRPSAVRCLGVMGTDWRGRELLKALEGTGADTASLVLSDKRITNTYIKPLREGISSVVYEDPRLDFSNQAPMSRDDEAALLESLDRLSGTLDALCVCDQAPFGCITPRVRDKLCALGSDGLTVVVDSREHLTEFHDVIIKPNDLEVCQALHLPHPADDETLRLAAVQLERRTRRPVVITLGAAGCLLCNSGVVSHVPAIPCPGPIDVCGAGDCFLSAFTASLAAGASLAEAAELACRAAAVVVRKINMTGTATQEEIDPVSV